MSWLADRQTEHNSVSVVYARAGVSVTVDAVLGVTEQVIAGSDGQPQIARTDRDYLIKSALLVLSGSPITPTKGDRITYDGSTYEVNQIPGEKCYRPCDPRGRMLRIHTKKIA